MFEPPYFERALLAGGAVLLVLGLVLWHALPIASGFPPYIVTSLLAIGYGWYEAWTLRARHKRDRE
jgi:4-hydroxybenzoate polyprenyltransferase